MKSTKQTATRSFFGGPLSTRERCKAALESCKSEDTPRKKPLPSTGLQERVTKQVGRQSGTATAHKSGVKRTELERNRRSTPTRRVQHGVSEKQRTAEPPLPQKTNAGMSGMKGARRAKVIRRKTPMTEATKKKTTAPPMTTGVKRRTEMSERVVGGRKRVRQPDPPKRVVHEGFFDMMRRKAQGNVPNQKRQVIREVRVVNEMDDFIAHDEEDEEVDWRAELRKTTKYNPSKFQDDCFDDKSMESSLHQCWKEERHSNQIGRLEDQRELQRELKRKGVKNG